MSEFDPLAMPLSGLRLIEASAGTGKTFSLAGLYLRLLVEKRLDVRDILVMTFTRAATQELRERIRARIASAARLVGNPGAATDATEDRLTLALLESSDEPPEALARRLRDAAVRMDEATISTIHGFSQRAVTENAFDSAVAFDRGEQIEDRELLDETVADYWRGRVIGQAASSAERFLKHWPAPKDLAADLGWLLTTPYLQLAGPAPEAIARQVADARAGWDRRAADLQAWLEAVAAADEFTAKGKLRRFVSEAGGVGSLFAAINAEVLAEHGIRVPEALALLSSNSLPGQIKGRAKKAGAPTDLTQPVDAVLAVAGLERLAMICDAADAVRVTMQRRKRERRSYSFNDMIESLHQAVTDPEQGPALAEALRRRWRWALVDEFQDTDPLQYAILKAVYHGHDGVGMIMIGDPKQAIYGFRGGDVFAYLHAAGDAEGQYSLDTNYRSTSGVLQAVESLFAQPTERPFMLPEIRFMPVQAGRKDRDRVIELEGKPLPALTLWSLEPVDAENADKPLAAEQAREQLADATVRQIIHLLDRERGARVREDDDTRMLAARDLCVLVNTNSEAARFQARLARAGVPASCLHQSSVFDSEQAAQMLRVLEAVAAPADPRRARAALVTELFGLRLGDLLALADDDRVWQRTMDRFQSAHERWNASGVLAMLEPLIQRASPRLLTLEDGERRMTNWLHLAEQLQQAETETFGMAGLIRWLSERRSAGAGEGAEEAQLRLESDADVVRIATVHKVKGLQFPVVLLPFAPLLGTSGAHFDRPDSPPFRFHDAAGAAWLDVGCGQDDEHAPLAVRERRAEAMRLLYVAVTRAEQALFLPWGLINGAQNSALAWLLHQRDGASDSAWQTRKAEYGDWFTAANVHAGIDRLCASAPGAIERVGVDEIAPGRSRALEPAPELGPARSDFPPPHRPWQMLSYSALIRGEPSAPAAAAGVDDESLRAEPGAPADPGLEGLAGTGFGSAVHDILEAADFAGWSLPGTEPTAAETAQITRQLLRRGIVVPEGEPGRDRITAVAGLVARCLHTPLPEIGPLSAIPAARRLAEMGFAMRLGGQTAGAVTALLRDHGYSSLLSEEHGDRVLRGLMQGFIDLLVEHEGRYWVLDYKTNWLGPLRGDYRPERLSAAVRHGYYDLQYLIYVTALHRYLSLRLPGYDPDRHLGGVQYLFVRGMNGHDDATGVFVDHPPVPLIAALDRVFDGEVVPT